MNSHAIIMIKRKGLLAAEDSYSHEMLARIPDGTPVKVKVTVPRNIKHHRKFFALLNLVFDSQPEPKMFATVDGLLDALKIATGHVREFRDLHGNMHIVPSSISIGAMDQLKFEEFYNQAVNVILERVLPHCPRADIEQQIFNMLGEPGPDILRGH